MVYVRSTEGSAGERRSRAGKEEKGEEEQSSDPDGYNIIHVLSVMMLPWEINLSGCQAILVAVKPVGSRSFSRMNVKAVAASEVHSASIHGAVCAPHEHPGYLMEMNTAKMLQNEQKQQFFCHFSCMKFGGFLIGTCSRELSTRKAPFFASVTESLRIFIILTSSNCSTFHSFCPAFFS